MFITGKNRICFWTGTIIPILYLTLLLFIAHRHALFTEWDGAMQYLSSIEINSGKGYHGMSAHFWPPLYATLIAIFTHIFRDGFAVAKFISVISSSLLLWVIYRFLYKLTGKKIPALLAQLFIAANPVYFCYSFQAQNMMLDTLFYVSAVCLFFETLQSSSYKYLFLTGVVAGLAGLTRYTSYALIPAFILVLFLYYRPKIAGLNISMLLLGFVIASLPWWIINAVNTGGPLNSWHYLNIGYGMVFQSRMEGVKWWWHDQAAYNSFREIFIASPMAYFKHVLQNLMRAGYIITVNSVLALIGCVALFFIQYIYAKGSKFIAVSNKFFFVIAICFLVYTGIICQAFVLDRLFLSWYAIIVMAMFIALYTISESDFPLKKFRPLLATGLLLFLFLNVLISVHRINYFLDNTDSSGLLAENEKIALLLKTSDGGSSKKIVMAVHPARAYYLGCQFVLTPLYYEGNNINDLVAYHHLDKKIINYVPRFPSNLDIEKQKADYIIFDRSSSTNLPQFSFLLDEHADKIPPNFERLLLTHDVAVYRIHK